MSYIKVAGSLFKREISYTYKQVVKVATTETKPEKVANMVVTFLNEDITGSLFKRAISYTYQADG